MAFEWKRYWGWSLVCSPLATSSRGFSFGQGYHQESWCEQTCSGKGYPSFAFNQGSQSWRTCGLSCRCYQYSALLHRFDWRLCLLRSALSRISQSCWTRDRYELRICCQWTLNPMLARFHLTSLVELLCLSISNPLALPRLSSSWGPALSSLGFLSGFLQSYFLKRL